VPGGGEPENAELIMHAAFRIGDLEILASDGDLSGKPEFKGMYLSIAFSDIGEAKRVFSALSERGEVRMAFEKTFFSAGFGTLADQFGVLWMINVME
jgi:PhnB protein